VLLGIDICGMYDGAIFNTTNFLGSYYSVQLENALVDDIYVTVNTAVSTTTVKPTSWSSQDILNADFQNTLEGGSISGNGQYITSVVIQNRDANGLIWNTVTNIPYVQGTNVLFQYNDKYVQNGESYEYTLTPYINSVQGIVAPVGVYITANFDATFLTDKNNNYMLMYDIKQGDITYNQNSKIFEPLDAQYPIIQYGSLNYRTGKISATLLSDTSLNSSTGFVINSEVVLRQNLIAFLTNRQAKLLRNRFGENILVTIVNKPSISFATSQPIATVNFEFIELNNINSSTLSQYGL